jgi:hypothetical protein
VGIEKFCDRNVVPVFFAFQIVFHEDERLLRRAIHSIKFSVRAAFLDWRDFYLIDIETRKMHSRLAKKEIGSHVALDIDVAMDAARSAAGADNTTLEATS